MYTAPPGTSTPTAEDYAAWSQPIGPIVELPESKLAAPGEDPQPSPCVLKGQYVDLVPLTDEIIRDDLWHAIGGGGGSGDTASNGAAGNGHAHPNDRLWTYMLNGPFVEHEAFVEAQKELAWHSGLVLFAVVPKVDPQTLAPLQGPLKAKGRLALMRCDPANRSVEVGHVLYSPELQRSPASTEPVALLARYVFADLGYRRFEWKCHSFNAPSMKAAERLGFTFEGIFRKVLIIKGRSRDTAWWSIIDDEWRDVIDEPMKVWLDRSNFDEHGRQKRTLQDVRKEHLAAVAR
ncbi:unnamed protein product [Parajaminaea phylloscopi]